jgi:hypothetical protein
MERTKLEVLVISVLASVAGIHCPHTVPPCSPPPPTFAPTQCTDYPSWPSSASAALQAQRDEEWSVYDAKVLYNALPTAQQQQVGTQLTTALNDINQADTAFIQAVDAAVAASNQNWTQALVDLEKALETLINLVNSVQASASSDGQAKAADAASRLADMKTQGH